MKAFLVDLITKILIKVIRAFRPTHIEGGSDGTTEKKLKDQVKEDGWDV